MASASSKAKCILLLKEIEELEVKLQEKRSELTKLEELDNLCPYSNGLSRDEVVRYSRQMLVPELGLKGQNLLKNSKILIVGAGGLGCPAALYLASAGVGEITLVDYDEVELSNLHRQVLHFEEDVGVDKVQSAARKLSKLNSKIRIVPLKLTADGNSLKKIVKNGKFDVIVDGSDNVATRYLLNDFCVLNSIPLVSGSALRMEGQLTVYNYENGPCYRCLFPEPPPPETVTNCGDGGVLGPIPGTIGVLQALETIKILTKSSETLSGRLLLFDGSSCTFRNVKLRNKKANCEVCGENPKITDLIDYEQFCQSRSHDKVININILNEESHIDVTKLNEKKIIVDVRPKVEFEMCSLPLTINVPFEEIVKERKNEELEKIFSNYPEEKVYFVCRRGNDSQRAVKMLKERYSGLDSRLVNVKGGLYSYSKQVDSSFPVY